MKTEFIIKQSKSRKDLVTMPDHSKLIRKRIFLFTQNKIAGSIFIVQNAVLKSDIFLTRKICSLNGFLIRIFMHPIICKIGVKLHMICILIDEKTLNFIAS